MKTWTIMLALLGLFLAGCAGKPFYTYGGVRYDSKEEFHAAVERSVSDAVAETQPLVTPVSSKALVFAIPNTETLIQENRRRFMATNNREPNSVQTEIMENLSQSAYRNLRVFGEAVQRRNIFRSVQIVDLRTMNASLEASADQDVLFFVEPGVGSAQWFYVNSKHGRQLFSHDRSPPTASGKVKSFVEAVQLQAIRD